MICCWNSDSTKIAVGYDDGATVWDVLKSHKIADIATGLTIRKVIFSMGPIDLLFVAANRFEGSITVVDARTFDGQQVMKVGNSVGQIWCSLDGRKLFAALEGRVCEFDVDVCRRRSFPSGELT